MRQRSSFSLVAGAVLALACSVSSAAPLTPGAVIVGPAGTTVAAQPGLAGTIVEDIVAPFSYAGWLTDTSQEPVTYTGNVTGTVQSRVVHSVDGTYDFYWRISVDRQSFLSVLDFDVKGFAPATHNADWRSDGQGSVVPALIVQGLSGDVRFAFGEYIEPSTQVGAGEHSRFLFLDTSARGYSGGASFTLASGRDTGGSMHIQWGGRSDAYPTFMPTPVPEPSMAWLSLCGLAVLGFAATRSRRR